MSDWTKRPKLQDRTATPGLAIPGLMVPGLGATDYVWLTSESVNTLWVARMSAERSAIPGLGVPGLMVPGLGDVASSVDPWVKAS